jgi:hypothetical protein
LIPLEQKAVLSELRVEIAEKEVSCSIWASRKVYFLERAMFLASRVLYKLVSQALVLVPRVLPLLVSVLVPFPPWFLNLVCDTKVQSFAEFVGSWLATLAQVGLACVACIGFVGIVFAWVLAWISIRLVAFSRFATWEASKVLV